MSEETLQAVTELVDMIRTAKRAANREDLETEGYNYYKNRENDLITTLKRIVKNA